MPIALQKHSNHPIWLLPKEERQLISLLWLRQNSFTSPTTLLKRDQIHVSNLRFSLFVMINVLERPANHNCEGRRGQYSARYSPYNYLYYYSNLNKDKLIFLLQSTEMSHLHLIKIYIAQKPNQTLCNEQIPSTD